MKIKFIVTFFLFSICLFNSAHAQLDVNFNIGLQPAWGPVGYDRVENYYLPDIETYYNLSSHQYTYLVNGHWVSAYSLPQNCRNYDLFKSHKVVMNVKKPYLNHAVNRIRYASFRNKHDQAAIRSSRDRRYFENKSHPKHIEWKNNGHDNRNKNDGNKGHKNEEQRESKENGNHDR